MKKFLPKTSGFTLIELLIVIAILAILAAIGITVFSGVQKNSRDARRKEDINAVAQAMEVGFTDSTGQYAALAVAMFSSGAIPVDPLTGSSVCGSGDTAPCKYCTKASAGECAGGDTTIAAGAPAANTTFIVCANLETGTPRYYCRANQR